VRNEEMTIGKKMIGKEGEMIMTGKKMTMSGKRKRATTAQDALLTAVADNMTTRKMMATMRSALLIIQAGLLEATIAKALTSKGRHMEELNETNEAAGDKTKDPTQGAIADPINP
jgi:hypothetical protein